MLICAVGNRRDLANIARMLQARCCRIVIVRLLVLVLGRSNPFVLSSAYLYIPVDRAQREVTTAAANGTGEPLAAETSAYSEREIAINRAIHCAGTDVRIHLTG